MQLHVVALAIIGAEPLHRSVLLHVGDRAAFHVQLEHARVDRNAPPPETPFPELNPSPGDKRTALILGPFTAINCPHRPLCRPCLNSRSGFLVRISVTLISTLSFHDSPMRPPPG